MTVESGAKNDGELAAKSQRLGEILGGYRRVVVAYSGGVDSVFLLKAAIDRLGADNVLACIGVSESLAESEYRGGLEIAQEIGATVQVVQAEEMGNPDYLANTAQRCFHCRSDLYRLLTEVAQQNGYDAVLCGANVDDLGDYRPGHRAAEQYGVVSPLQQAELTKADIRALSKQLGLKTWDKPAAPCLASRVAYGLGITPERLKQIEKGEEYLRGMGFRFLRVRHHGDLVRIEVDAANIGVFLDEKRRGETVEFFKTLGFKYVSLDLQGFRSGSANEVLE